jgi:GNAT superfamily N-acetyltransferase
MIVCSKTPLVFGSVAIGTEHAWWVEPELRKQGVGDLLVEAFESWAKGAGCVLATLSFLDLDLSNYMKTKGYERYESAHIKVL